MENKVFKSWEEFEQALVDINDKTKQLYEKYGCKFFPLFRGVSDSEYHLESTLDRIKKKVKFSEYQRILKIVCKHVATCTGRKWDIETAVSTIHLGDFELPLSTYEFMAYLRHNGFPSPLIDWTKSAYIAAFFAFRDIYSKAEYISIFCGLWNCQYGDEPRIYPLGHTIATDYKHYLQQSEYSICVGVENKETYFADHEDVEGDEEGALIKYDIPASERQKVLKKLDSMNITAYSLFDSEPSLMETLALRELFLK